MSVLFLNRIDFESWDTKALRRFVARLQGYTARVDAPLSDAAIAKCFGVTDNTISVLLSGRLSPHVNGRISRFAWLFEHSDPAVKAAFFEALLNSDKCESHPAFAVCSELSIHDAMQRFFDSHAELGLKKYAWAYLFGYNRKSFFKMIAPSHSKPIANLPSLLRIMYLFNNIGPVPKARFVQAVKEGAEYGTELDPDKQGDTPTIDITTSALGGYSTDYHDLLIALKILAGLKGEEVSAILKTHFPQRNYSDSQIAACLLGSQHRNRRPTTRRLIRDFVVALAAHQELTLNMEEAVTLQLYSNSQVVSFLDGHIRSRRHLKDQFPPDTMAEILSTVAFFLSVRQGDIDAE